MENFFYEDNFCNDIEDLMFIKDINDENISDLADDWVCKVELTTLEPMFQLSANKLSDMLCNDNEERFSEDGAQSEDIVKALNQCVDFEKLNSMIPSLWYPNGKDATITKKDLIEYLN